jgi:2-oxoglutarate dehydrogenase E1 component
VTNHLTEEVSTIKDVEEYLNKMYCGTVGVEFEHIQNEDERLWLYENHETAMKEQFSAAEKVKMV